MIDLTKLYRKDGKINSAVLRQPYFLESDLYKQVVFESKKYGCDDYSSIAERLYVINSRLIGGLCKVCQIRKVLFHPKTGFGSTCSNRSCSAINAQVKTRQTIQLKYGAGASPLTRQKARERSGNLNLKGRETLKHKYGVINPGQLPDHDKKVRATLQARYGVSSTAELKHVKEASFIRSLAFFQGLVFSDDSISGMEIISPSDLKRGYYRSPCQVIKFNCDKHGVDQLPSETFKWRARNLSSVCSTCVRPFSKNITIAQQEIATFLESNGEIIKLNDRSVISPLEIDIMIPSRKIGIEYHGLFWHSYSSPESKSEREYHAHKQKMSESAGITLLQIFEDEWIYKRDIVKSIIKAKIGKLDTRIFARNCEIDKSVTPNETRKFLDENHLQGYCQSKLRIGLRYQGTLIAMITAGSSRFKAGEIELLRACTKINMSIPGGISRLIKTLMNLLNGKDLITFADLRYSTAQSYLKIGFKILSKTPPGFFYTDKNRRFNRMSFQKHLLPQKLVDYDSSKTAQQNMFDAGYRRIWDCGHLKLILKSTL